VVHTDFKIKTFATEQKMLLFTQIMILVGLAIQAGMFFALLWWGRPPANDYALVLEFFMVAALWVIVINLGIVLFWWVSKLGPWAFPAEEKQEKTGIN
jgi:hypothetical protein